MTENQNITAQNQPLTTMKVSLAEDGASLNFRSDLEPKIEQSVERRIKKYALWVFSSIILVVFGAIIATIWQLNGAIYQAVGKASEYGLQTEILRMKIDELEKRNQVLNKTIACLREPKKGGCQDGN